MGAAVDERVQPQRLTPNAPPPGRPRSPLVLELAVVACLVWIYDWLQNLAPLRKGLALHHAVLIFSFERHYGVEPEKSLNHWLIAHPLIANIASNFYDNAIFVVTFGLVAWTWWRRPDIYRPLRDYLVLANVIGFAVFWAYPLAPPRMLAGFVDVVGKYPGIGGWHNELISHADQLAAMPSMHLAWSVWSSLAIWRLWGRGAARKVVGCLAVLYPVVTAWDVMATGNHFLLDVLAGAATTGISVLVVEVVSRRYHLSWTRWRSSLS
ncbi:MAG: phosphatase PAP2 family protein [Acidimicrobiales bacterium]